MVMSWNTPEQRQHNRASYHDDHETATLDHAATLPKRLLLLTDRQASDVRRVVA
jgi:hypothetical protein